MQADPTLHVDRQRDLSSQTLQQDEGGLLADEPARLVAFGDQAIDPQRDASARLIEAGRLQEDASPARAQNRDHLRQPRLQ